MAEDESNELSWLKSSPKSPLASPLHQDNKDAPSWLFEDKDASTAGSSKSITSSAKPRTSIEKISRGVKWKQPINKNSDLTEQEEDGDSCCCCCPSDPMLFSFQIFHFIAGFSGLAAFIANIYVFTRSDLSIRDAIMRSYALILCALVVIIEMDWRFIVNKMRFVDWWVFRGAFYTFIGFITFGIIDSSAEVSSAPQEVVGVVLFAVGFCYMIMGTFCMKSMKQRRMIQLIQRDHAPVHTSGSSTALRSQSEDIV